MSRDGCHALTEVQTDSKTHQLNHTPRRATPRQLNCTEHAYEYSGHCRVAGPDRSTQHHVYNRRLRFMDSTLLKCGCMLVCDSDVLKMHTHDDEVCARMPNSIHVCGAPTYTVATAPSSPMPLSGQSTNGEHEYHNSTISQRSLRAYKRMSIHRATSKQQMQYTNCGYQQHAQSQPLLTAKVQTG